MQMAADSDADAMATDAQDRAVAAADSGGMEAVAEQANDDTRPAAKAATCGVCNTEPPKYKCPRCYLP